jgi:hemoglobin
MKKRTFSGAAGVTLVLSLVLSTGCAGAGRKDRAPRFDAEKTGKTLYQRLGQMEPSKGEPKLNATYRIASIVSEVVDRMNANRVIMANPKVTGINQRVMPGHKFEFTLMVLEKAGGPQKYTGRRLDEAHRHLGITDEQWAAMMTEFDDVLGKQGCPARETKDFLNLIESTRSGVIP